MNDDNSGGGNNNNNTGIEEGAAPAKNTLYKDCFVIKTEDDNTGEYVIVTLLHKLELQIDGSEYSSQQELETEINTSLPTFNINGITGWRLPTKAEAQASVDDWDVANQLFINAGSPIISNDNYYYLDGSTIKAHPGHVAPNSLPYSSGERLRPVTTVMFAK